MTEHATSPSVTEPECDGDWHEPGCPACGQSALDVLRATIRAYREAEPETPAAPSGLNDIEYEAVVLLCKWREASLESDASTLGDLTDQTSDFLEQLPAATQAAEAAALAARPADPVLDSREPHPDVVKRIARHLLGEDIVNIRAAVESFPNGYTVVRKDDAARPAEAQARAGIDVERLARAERVLRKRLRQRDPESCLWMDGVDEHAANLAAEYDRLSSLPTEPEAER